MQLAAALAMLIPGQISAEPAKPTSVIHVITVQWNANASKEDIQKAIRGVETMNYAGLRRVWTRPIKMQLPEGYDHIIVMEFESEEALKKYADSPAQQQWYKVYMPVRAESRTHDITN